MTQYLKRPAERLHYLPASEYHPANTYFHFSFANYHDPGNIHYGVLRVVNDDDVQPHAGFDQYSHRNMEIVSYLLHGKLTHWDSVAQEEDVPELAEGRQAYVSCMEGSLVLAGMTDLAERDSLEVTGPATLRMQTPTGHGHAIIIEMPRMDERYRG